MSDPVSAIDNSPMAKIFNAILEEGPGLVGKALGKVASITNAAIESTGSVFGSVKESLLGASHSAPSGPSQEVAVARTREPEITAPAKSNAYEVSMTELGSFSAPTFSGAARSNGGMGIG